MDLKEITMADWDGKYISPYAEHGKKSEQVKKITVSIPIKVLEILTNERTRRQIRNLRHATNSELLCEAFLHAFTGQPLPLISKGGTSILINSVYIGIILSISRHVYELQAQKEEEEALKEAQLHDAAISILKNAALELAEKDSAEKEKETN